MPFFAKSWKNCRSVEGSAFKYGWPPEAGVLSTYHRVVNHIVCCSCFLEHVYSDNVVLLRKNKSSNSRSSAFAPISLQHLQFLLMGTQKYFCLMVQGTLATTLFVKFSKFRVRVELKLYCFLLFFLCKSYSS